jgi:lipopolysaccharide transport protein LptA
VKRLRFFRFLLLALLVPFVVFVVLMLRNPPGGLSDVSESFPGIVVEQIEFHEFADGELSLSLQAARGEQETDGTYRIEDVQRLEVHRKDATPLIIQAGWGFLEGPVGRRFGRLEGGVQVEDQDEELLLSVPIVEFNQVEGEARSLGLVTLDSPRYEGKAAAVVYGLNGQPTILVSPDLKQSDGSTLSADRATLLDGTRDVELVGNIRAASGETRLQAGRGRIRRTEEGQLRQVELFESVEGISLPTDSPFSSLETENLEARWDDAGEPSYLRLQTDSFVQHGTTSLRAEEIEAQRATALLSDPVAMALAAAAGSPPVWALSAEGDVRVSVLMGTGGPAILVSDEFTARMDAAGNPLDGEARGDVRFKSDETSGEAQRATFDARSTEEQIVLHASARHRARLSRGRSRVAAERIVTNAEGSRLVADGRVEASLLGSSRGEGGGTGLFRNDEAIHFVSKHLEGNPSANALVFTGAVRGWQGERNLSADRVEVDQDRERLDADGNVTTRLPRVESGPTASSADYLQVASERLRYRGREGHAVFDGVVKVRLIEGWLDSQELDVSLTEGDQTVREILASGEVRFELQSPEAEESDPPVTGEGDRVLYEPLKRTVTLYGDRTPAAIRRQADQGGTTRGRVLRYHLDTGDLEVESGDRDRAKIKTSES